ncbi:MAG: Rieske 2Fe-2S domain-containing protein [Gammaproteobacteria bacterium]|nr:Rieske 2Fe-2S domain-containing protein [Gammaproteobacteria bacterium]NKB64924.1 Rieske 2Fe-2S domain-containing protein [Gammaproteobacteria bacterium]
MTHTSPLQIDLNNCRLPIDEASSLPAACYHSESILKQEHALIFQHHWLGLGRADRFTTPGQFETVEISNVPLILMMDNQGELHAFNNACRHRGARLLNGNGSTTGIRCPFHSWYYGTDGRLVSAPQMENTKGFCKEAAGLVEFSLRIHAGFIFVCFNPDPPDFDKHIGDFDEIHAPWPIDTLVSTRRISIEVNCNWKLFLDVFNEYYHLQSVHPSSLNDTYYTPDPADTTLGNYASQFGETQGSSGLLQEQQEQVLPLIPGLTGREKNGTRYSWIYPNMAFAVSPEAMWIYEAYPISPGRCLAYQTLCFPPSSVKLDDFETRAEFYYERFDAAVEEDRIALENQQKGMNSPFTIPRRYSTIMEPSVGAFASWYNTQLQPS